MKLLDRMPIYPVNKRDVATRDHFYAKLRLNEGGASLFRGVSSLTEELVDWIDEFADSGVNANQDFAIHIEVLLYLTYKAWLDTLDCLYPEETKEKQDYLSLIKELNDNVDIVEKYLDLDEYYFAKNVAPDIIKVFIHLKDDVISKLLEKVKTIM